MGRLNLTSSEEKVYTALWKKVTGGEDTLDAGDAVGLLMESKLDEPVLHEIWEHSDLEGEGYLNIDGFKIALKLVALVQAGNSADMGLLKTPTAIADLGKHTKALAHLVESAKSAAGADAGDAGGWVIKADEKARYDESFDQLGPTDDDIITGKKARKVLMKTGLSQDVLGKIWELADIDSDGNLDRDEFAVAMHLIRSCMSGKDAPDTLPADLMPPSKRGGAGVRAASPPAEAVVPPTKAPEPKAPEPKATVKPAAAPAPKATPSAKPARASAATSAESHDWVVTAKELKTYDDFFKTADKDKDGLVSGGDIMKIFLTSKLPKDVLAHVWNLVDLDDSGEINSEQFALAMHFIAQKVKGSEIPKKLTANMVPPSLRSKFAGGSADDGSAGAVGGGGNEAELREAQKTNSQLKDEIKATESEIKVETEDLSSMTAEIKELRADEKRLRAELKAGKDKLVEVLAQKRKAKADKKKIEGKISTLTASKSKVEAGLKSTGYYDTTGPKASSGGGSGNGAGAGSDPMETHGMSMADYFGQ
eukprot:m.376229 g.376229  ORF g.376229 m.376229 type:complete len:536 (-) comp28191_c0_seq2:3651-5258(-)